MYCPHVGGGGAIGCDTMYVVHHNNTIIQYTWEKYFEMVFLFQKRMNGVVFDELFSRDTAKFSSMQKMAKSSSWRERERRPDRNVGPRKLVLFSI